MTKFGVFLVLKTQQSWEVWLAQSVEQRTHDLGVMGPSATMRMEITEK